MPKNSNQITRSKSTRKPLRDVSNSNGVKSFAKSSKNVKKIPKNHERLPEDGSLDRLLLVHSELSSLVRQIDEVVVQALKLTSKKGRKDTEPFAKVLTELQYELKPWVPRLQKALADLLSSPEIQLEQSLAMHEFCTLDEKVTTVADSPEATKWDSLVSPSPLVSWRADCMVVNPKQLFLLTPLPRPKVLSSKHEGSHKELPSKVISYIGLSERSPVERENSSKDLLQSFDVEPTPKQVLGSDFVKLKNSQEVTFVSPTKVSRKEHSRVVMTPSLKISPPRSCVLLEPSSEFCRQKNNKEIHKSTPYPLVICDPRDSQNSESNNDEAPAHFTTRYPELVGIRVGCRNRKKMLEESPNWFISPPKTCVLMEPPEENLSPKATTEAMLNNVQSDSLQTNCSLGKDKNCEDCYSQQTSISVQEHRGSLDIVESTPWLKEAGSTIRVGKLPGENTLKKELWTRFEAASLQGIRFEASTLQKTAQKGFLDRLDEVSLDETSPLPDELRL